MNWESLRNANCSQLIEWAETRPWCQAMAECQQDAEWHAEGDVWTHTKMVLHELTELEEWSILDPQQQCLLRFTALFHDIAKPLTSKQDPKTGRIRSPKHAVKGEHVARSILRELECDFETREQIARLVRYHGRPAFLAKKKDPANEVIRLSWLVNHQLLYLFAVADTRGRDSDSMSRPEENLEYWKLVAEENDCYQQPFSFASSHARFIYFRDPQPNVYYVPHEEFSCHVTLMSGLPGSGKDSWLAKNHDDKPVISLDSLRQELGIDPTDDQGEVIQKARELCREMLRNGTDFAFNATNTVPPTRVRWIDLFADYNAYIEIVYVEPAFQQLLEQNRDRQSPVPTQVLQKLADKCQPPTLVECHALTLVTH